VDTKFFSITKTFSEMELVFGLNQCYNGQNVAKTGNLRNPPKGRPFGGVFDGVIYKSLYATSPSTFRGNFLRFFSSNTVQYNKKQGKTGEGYTE